MTVIAAGVHDGQVWMGGDSAGVGGLYLEIRKDPKVFRTGNFLIGFTSSFRMGQVLRFGFTPPAFPEGMDVYEYMVAHFVEAVRTTLKSAGYARTESGEESGGTFLVAYRGRLFKIQDDFQVGESAAPYAAVGCGAEIAEGALYAALNLPGIERNPGAFLDLALRAAEQHSAGVRGPFEVLKLPAP